MSFIRFISVLEALAMRGAGATVGKIAATNPVYTQAQLKATLKDLIGEGMVTVEKVQYRPHIMSNVYHISEKAREYVGYVADKYDAAELQKTMFNHPILDLVELSEISAVDGEK